MKFAQFIDHTLLKATAAEADILQLCEEATKYNFYAVCVNSCYVGLCKQKLNNSDVKIACVVGFPLGAMHTFSKINEAAEAVRNGADEIDMVINIGFLKDLKYELVEDEILLVLPVAPRHERCGLPGLADAGERIHPFATLAGLKARLN